VIGSDEEKDALHISILTPHVFVFQYLYN